MKTFERLEARCHCDSTLSRHVLHVLGTDSSDSITVAPDGRAVVVTVNGHVHARRYRADAVPLIKVDAGGGSDVVELLGDLAIPASIDGGRGNDRLLGGSGNDTLLGGDGNDSLFGRVGIDYLDGGSGDDHFRDPSSVNVIYGGPGTDRVDYDNAQSLNNYFFSSIESGGQSYATYIGVTRRHDRLLLNAHVYDPGDGIYTISGPVTRSDGNLYVRERFAIRGPAVDPYSFDKTLDVTAASGRTLYFVTNDTDPTIEYPTTAPTHAVTLPLLLPETTI